VSEDVYAGKGLMPENHLWGPRDYFKGDFYKDTFCHFASETGYHGFNSPKSLERFLKEPARIFEDDGTPTAEYLVHASGMETKSDAPYAYRIRLAYNQVVTLFGEAAEELDDFVRQSQISQAEAKKYFIEKFRIGKGKRTGILWWNLVDGWPQVSDAIVDYYYVKKLAYHYIKRSQQPVCLMFDEPENGAINLIAVNDLPASRQVSYTVKKYDPLTNTDAEILSDEVFLDADAVTNLAAVELPENEKHFYFIEWTMSGKNHQNHYFTNILDIDYSDYMLALQKYGMDEFEGFGEELE
jgi:beta-mannosidase